MLTGQVQIILQRKTVRSFLPPNKAHLVKEQETKQKEKNLPRSHLPVMGARLSLGGTVDTFEALALFLWASIPSLEGEEDQQGRRLRSQRRMAGMGLVGPRAK